MNHMKRLLLMITLAGLSFLPNARAETDREDCPHDGDHGDAMTVTVEHNGRTATRTIATAEMLESKCELIADTAIDAFNETSPVKISTVNSDAASTFAQSWDFYRWMTKAEDIAATRDINIDGCEGMFAAYYERGETPRKAVSSYLGEKVATEPGGEIAVAGGEPDEYAQFDEWIARVREIAPQYNFVIAENDETPEEYFWLYCFPVGMTPAQAITDIQQNARTAERNSAPPPPK
jgi:hypothetical protein